MKTLAASPFSARQLEQAREVYGPWLKFVFETNLLAAMTPSRRAALRQIGLELPVQFPAGYGADPGFPLHVAADFRRRMVVLPLQTIMWLDEYAGLWAWLHRNHPDKALILCMLFAAMAATNPSSRPVGPFEAFGLSSSIYDDGFVKDVSNKCLNGALCFLLLHELGHLALNHAAVRTNIESQEQERAADGYALDAMAELHILALGVPFLFFATAAMEQGQTTHPASGSRIAAIAYRLEAEAYRYVDRNDRNAPQTEEKLREYGRALRNIAVPMLLNPEERIKFMRLAINHGMADLKSLI